ncbi:MucR family transcriptional regulator [Methylobacterium nigriterrae]|uniref:MucR family transcriptional regulator n=1 Tax=Methylobacterium nigriterrae TaxID=3127512 RepID=UPI0030137B66
MAEIEEALKDNYLELAGDIVSAYVSNNPVPVAELPALIGNVHAALNALAAGPSAAAPAEEVEKATPAQIRKSITPDAIISFIDGKPYKTLKRHLTGHGLDPYSYRQRYGLPADYPMVAASYAAQRSELAKAIGLGRLGGMAQDDAEEETSQKAPKTRGRPKKA